MFIIIFLTLRSWGKHKVQEVFKMIVPLFSNNHRLNDMEHALVKAWMKDLLEVGLVELSKGEYALPIIIATKKNIFDNWTKCQVCGNHKTINNQTWFDKYTMPLLGEIFYFIG